MARRVHVPYLQIVVSPLADKAPPALEATEAKNADGAHKLQLVTTPSVEHADRKGEQLSLFVEAPPTHIGVIHMKRVRSRRFLELLRSFRPRVLFDLRPVPVFEIDRMTRREAFGVFDECNADYWDVVRDLGILTRQDASFASGRVANEISRIIAAQGYKNVPGPVVFLVDGDEIQTISTVILPQQIRPKPKGGWVAQVLE